MSYQKRIKTLEAKLQDNDDKLPLLVVQNQEEANQVAEAYRLAGKIIKGPIIIFPQLPSLKPGEQRRSNRSRFPNQTCEEK